MGEKYCHYKKTRGEGDIKKNVFPGLQSPEYGTLYRAHNIFSI